MRLIDADALRAEFPMPADITDPNQALVHITGIWAEIDNAPTIEERKTGKWIEITPEEGHDIYTVKCDQCGVYVFFETNYCHHCGAKMEGKA